MFTTDGFDTVDVAPPFMSSTENNTQGARRDEQQTRFLSRENIVKMLKTTIVLSALFMSIDGHTAILELDVWSGIGNDSNAGTYGALVATSNHLLFIADDGQHGHTLHQYLRSSIRDQWMVWD